MGSHVLGEFELMVLLAVLHLGEEAYAVSIVEEITARTGREVKRAAVYVTLRRLEQKGFVRSWLGAPTRERGGKAKRHVAVEPAGMAAARDTRDALRSMWGGLEPLLAEGR